MFRRRRGPKLVDEPRRTLAHHVADWALLNDDEQQRVLDSTAHYIDEFRWEPSNGFTLTDEMATIIAAQAAVMALGFDDNPFRNVRAVVVHPRTMTTAGPRHGPVPGVMTDEPSHHDGEAHDRLGPVLLSWRAVRADTRHRGTGSNVVVHELAHKLDMADGTIDGTPTLVPAELREQWVKICTREYRMIRAGREHLLRDYAGTTTGEFFAVACESFFDRGEQLLARHPQLYELLRTCFRQDPAARRPLVTSE
jgi:MtfA peptidase